MSNCLLKISKILDPKAVSVPCYKVGQKLQLELPSLKSAKSKAVHIKATPTQMETIWE